MAVDKLYILKDVPEVKWTTGSLKAICREHSFELDEGRHGQWGWEDDFQGYAHKLRCVEGPHYIDLPSRISEIRDYIRKKLDSTLYTEAKLVDLDGLLVPVSKKEKVDVGNSEYFVTSQVRSGKRGDQVVIYAGKKGSKSKVQVFVDPEHKRMSFDQNDLNPADVFAKLEATFRGGTKHTIQSESDV